MNSTGVPGLFAWELAYDPFLGFMSGVLPLVDGGANGIYDYEAKLTSAIDDYDVFQDSMMSGNTVESQEYEVVRIPFPSRSSTTSSIADAGRH